MPTFKLYYFNGKGRAEVARWLFAEAGVEYEDVRLSGEEWAERKSEFPFLQLPVLEVTDETGTAVRIAESHAIYRFLAREFGLTGRTNLDMARADMICERIDNLGRDLPYREQDLEKRQKAFEDAIAGPLGAGLKRIEKYVQDDGFFVGDGVTIADIFLTVACDFALLVLPDALEGTPKLKLLMQRVKNLPRIKEWIAKRPETPM